MEAFSKENRGFQELNTMMRTGSRARVRRPRVQAGGAMVVHLWNSVVMAPTPQLPMLRQGRAACGPGVGEVGLPVRTGPGSRCGFVALTHLCRVGWVRGFRVQLSSKALGPQAPSCP